MLEGIHRRSPLARVAIVGYPDVLPAHGGCYLETDERAVLARPVERVLELL